MTAAMSSLTSQSSMKMPIVMGIAVLALLLLVRGLSKLISHRSHFRKLQAQGLPMPPHSLVLGHLPVLIKAMKMYPGDANTAYIVPFIRQMYPQMGPDFYLDLYPFSVSMLVVGSPETLNQLSGKNSLPKNVLLANYLRPLTDGLDIISANGPLWKQWRAIFNPGFSSAHVMKLAPVIVKEAEIFCELLEKRAKKDEVFPIKSLTDNLILDIIAQVTLGVRLDCQKNANRFVQSLRTQINWLSSGAETDLLHRYNPLRPFVQWYHSRIVDDYVGKALDSRIQEVKTGSTESKKGKPQTITDLALKAYTESESTSGKAEAVMDSRFKKICMAQLKTFLFAGHDTTSSTVDWTLWCLSENPHTLTRMRSEHTQVFGPDPSKTAQAIIDNPHLISQLPYTTAVIKETLRFFPPATSTRDGAPDVNLIDAHNRIFPTQDIVVWQNQLSCQRDPAYWPDAERFSPERWLVGPEDPLHPIKGMWRPFEYGPRNCVGQELAMVEMKVIIVLVSRRFNFKPAYKELDVEKGKKDTKVLGLESYQLETLQPRDDMPVRVELCTDY